MNSVGFSGKLKKKYNAVDVQNAICSYSKEHGLAVQCPDETKAFVDFGIDSEGFCFSVENGKLTEQYVKYKADDAEKSWYIIVDAWIYYCMDFYGKPISEYPENHKKLNTALEAACFDYYSLI